ncbi:MAG TPA: amidase [Acidimicrobiales bacterium]|nr:amidase [Acidimicrobiales bacterium]
MATFIEVLDSSGDGPRLAVKDLIDVEGVPTTAGSRAQAAIAGPAAADAPCVAVARAAGARIVGKTNLHELAYGASGINPWFGTPENPLDASRVPGGSSSGSAVAVATGQADVALGTDTGGSVRLPSACCGTAGLKTTFGRIPTAGVWPLAQSLDTIGPMAADVAGVVLGMSLLEDGFAPSPVDGRRPRVGRIRNVVALDPVVDEAVDRALAAAEVDVIDVTLPGWQASMGAFMVLIATEAWVNDAPLLARDPDGIGADVTTLLRAGSALGGAEIRAARAAAVAWRAEVAAALADVDALALPTLPTFPPRLDEDPGSMILHTAAVNVAGNPALVLPVPAGGPLPASLQLIGPWYGEEQLVALGARVEAAVATR